MWSTDPRKVQHIYSFQSVLIFPSNAQTFNDFPGQWEPCVYTHSAHWQILKVMFHTHAHRHTHWNSVVVAVCVAMAACCCSDVVEPCSCLTRHQMCLLCDWPAGVTWERSSQSGRKSTFCELKACQHCEQRRGKEMQWWKGLGEDFLSPFLIKIVTFGKQKKV